MDISQKHSQGIEHCIADREIASSRQRQVGGGGGEDEAYAQMLVIAVSSATFVISKDAAQIDV